MVMPWEWILNLIRDGYERTTVSGLSFKLRTGTTLELWMKWAELLSWFSAYEALEVVTEEKVNSWGV